MKKLEEKKKTAEKDGKKTAVGGEKIDWGDDEGVDV
jgi:hypothetical protein